MAADETRLLVLGAVVLFEPLNGYQLRRELLSWGVEDWAHIKPGSIYSMLTTLTRDALVERFDVPDSGTTTRSVSVYASTPAGRKRFRAMVSDELRTVRAMKPVPFHLALNFCTLLPRDEVVDCLRSRLAAAQAVQRASAHRIADATPSASVPPHVVPTLDLEHRSGEVHLAWLGEHIDAIANGAFSFHGEPPQQWQPPADDSGWQIVADRDRYVQFISDERARRKHSTDE